MYESGHPLALILVAVMIGFPVLAWCFIPMSLRRRVAGLAVLATVFAGLFAWSQLRPGVLAPPLIEWGVAGWIASIPTLAVMATLAKLDLRGAWRRLRAQRFDFAVLLVLRGAWRRLRAERLSFALLLVPALLTGCIAGAGSMRDGPGAEPGQILWSHVADHEWRPIPAGTSVVKIEKGCTQPAPCPTIVTLATERSTAAAEPAASIVGHYDALGWHLKAESGEYTGCRAVQGILRWAEHCMRIAIGARAETEAEVSVNVDK